MFEFVINQLKDVKRYFLVVLFSFLSSLTLCDCSNQKATEHHFVVVLYAFLISRNDLSLIFLKHLNGGMVNVVITRAGRFKMDRKEKFNTTLVVVFFVCRRKRICAPV